MKINLATDKVSLTEIQIKWFWHLWRLERSLASPCLISLKVIYLLIIKKKEKKKSKEAMLSRKKRGIWLRKTSRSPLFFGQKRIHTNLADLVFIVSSHCFKCWVTSGPLKLALHSHFEILFDIKLSDLVEHLLQRNSSFSRIFMS